MSIRTIYSAGLAVLALALVSSTTPAVAGGGHGWYGAGYHKHHRHGHPHRWHRDRHRGSGLSLGFIFVQPPPPVYTSRYVYAAPPAPVYVVPPPRAAADCRPTTGTGVVADGRTALYGGTWCSDGFGNGYVVAGSEYFIRYLY